MSRTYYHYDLNGEVIEETDENGNTIVEYTREPDGTLISEYRNGVSRQYHFDGDGNTLALTDENGDVTDTFGYNSDGEVTERTGTTPTPYQFHGRDGLYRDSETGEYLENGRPMSPNEGRWLALEYSDLSQAFNSYPFPLNPTAIPMSLIPQSFPSFPAALFGEVPAENGGDKPGKEVDISKIKCKCDETLYAQRRKPFVEAIIDSEIDKNYDGYETGKGGFPTKIKRKKVLVDTGDSTIYVLLEKKYYAIACCINNSTNAARLEHFSEVDTPNLFVDAVQIGAKPPKPPTNKNKKKIVEYVWPVKFWATGAAPGSPEHNCLTAGIAANFGPRKTVPKGDYDS
jgi:hypothetical protein